MAGVAAPEALLGALTGTEPEGATAKPGLGIGMWLAIGWCTLLGLLVVLVPWLPFVKDPDELSAALQETPTAQHWFGTDDIGRDMFARVAWGGRVSLSIGLFSLALGFFIGGFVGLTAGYFRGRYERLVMSAIDVMLSFPSLILALALLRALSPAGETAGSLGKVTFVLTVLAIPALARITRANTLTFSKREFVLAARAMGAKPRRILTKEILPNVIPSMVSFAFVALAILVVAEGALAFLGLSVEAPQATWGKLIQDGSSLLDQSPHMALAPCIVMFLTLLSLTFIGDRMQTKFSAREAAI
jgi:peptide/nickel transport system permease protein